MYVVFLRPNATAPPALLSGAGLAMYDADALAALLQTEQVAPISGSLCVYIEKERHI